MATSYTSADEARNPRNLYQQHVPNAPDETGDEPRHQPDIDWVPSEINYEARRAERQASDLTGSLPERYPPRIHNPLVWSGQSMSASSYIKNLSPENLVEIENALSAFISK